MQRRKPPADITPHEFFTRWVPESVDHDDERRARLGETRAVVVFELGGEGGGAFSIHIDAGRVRGESGSTPAPDLTVRVDVATWRSLNEGALSAPEALLKRRLHLEGNFMLGLKLHLILGA